VSAGDDPHPCVRESVNMKRVTVLSKPVTVLVTIAVIVLVTVGVVRSMTNGAVTQPIAFNHNLHIDEIGLSCTDCHLYAETGVRATIPNREVCSDCHTEAVTESVEEARLIDYVNSGDPIPWAKVYRVPEHVWFSHRRHTGVAGIACETCHGQVGQRTQPLTRPLVQQTMEWCIDCHEERGASDDCIWCHR
jgi:hypothetical protein